MGRMYTGTCATYNDDESTSPTQESGEEYGRPRAGENEPATEKSFESCSSPTTRCKEAFGGVCGGNGEFIQDTSFRLKNPAVTGRAGENEPATEKCSENSAGNVVGCRTAFSRLCCRRNTDFFADTSFRLKNSRRDRVAYFMDRILAKRSRFFILLGVWGFLQVVFAGGCYSLVWSGELEDGDPRDADRVWRAIESIWEAWTFMADPGTHAKVFTTSERLVASAITLSG
eukprot:CAMPEP_0115501806 /NCGR_PEP_ID=MMETSP0271-20121206/68596_1 /TAXON_ID=71861 /ORGANISM="Scrippsiella trochoidea, Strain CCMP3099" /LENGTH=228 /DNA_ID=CAMNT_0002930769 /DNA_START=9 /DNA_END=693 /DNA_ORIENTATION=+